LKSAYQFDLPREAIIHPAIFSGYPNVLSGLSTKLGNRDQTRYEMNLSHTVGDDPDIVEMNRTAFFSHLGISAGELAIPFQCHSSNVLCVDKPGEYENCDALITTNKRVALVITIADCVPILLFDPIHKAIGAVHAGWRGSAQAIVKQALKKMRDEFNTESEQVLAFIGPSAGPCCYEVSEDVAVKFGNKIVPSHEKVSLDLKKENASQLLQLGVQEGHVEISGHCTICEKQLFHSFRRDGKNSGRMMAVICLTQ